MNINVEHQPNCRVIARIEVPADTVKKERAQIVSHYSSIARIPGYRPGKVPAHIIMQRHSDAVDGELQTRLVNKGLGAAIEKEKLEVLQVLNVSEQKFRDDGTYTFTGEITIAPKFELPEYKGIPVKLAKVEVTEHDIDHELFHLRENRANFNDVDRAAEKNDVLVLAYTGTIEGKPAAEVVAELAPVFHTVEENWFLLDEAQEHLPGFTAGLIGIKKDETRTLNLAIPDTFHSEGLRGKTLDLAVTCKGVKERTLPELNDELAKTFLGEEATLEQLRGEVRDSIRRRKEQGRDAELSNQVLAHLHDKLDFEMPEDLVSREAQRRTNDITNRALRGGMSEEEIMTKQEEIITSASQQAKQGVRVSFILEKIAENEKLTVNDAQLTMALARYAEQSKMPAKKFMAEANKSGLINRLRGDLLLENAVEFLKQHATIEEVEPAEDKHDCAFEKGEAA